MEKPSAQDFDFIFSLESKCISLTTGKLPWQMVTGAVRLANDELLEAIQSLYNPYDSNHLVYGIPLNVCFRDFLVPNNDESFSSFRGRYFMTPECHPKSHPEYGRVPKLVERISDELQEHIPRLPLKVQLYDSDGYRFGVTGYVMQDEFQLGLHYTDEKRTRLPALILAQRLYPVFRPSNKESRKILKL